METDTLKSIEDDYENDFSGMELDFAIIITDEKNHFTEDEIREAFEEAMNKVFA